jgi:hypothetical protein
MNNTQHIAFYRDRPFLSFDGLIYLNIAHYCILIISIFNTSDLTVELDRPFLYCQMRLGPENTMQPKIKNGLSIDRPL